VCILRGGLIAHATFIIKRRNYIREYPGCGCNTQYYKRHLHAKCTDTGFTLPLRKSCTSSLLLLHDHHISPHNYHYLYITNATLTPLLTPAQSPHPSDPSHDRISCDNQARLQAV
jgi:hypothetical protein